MLFYWYLSVVEGVKDGHRQRCLYESVRFKMGSCLIVISVVLYSTYLDRAHKANKTTRQAQMDMGK